MSKTKIIITCLITAFLLYLSNSLWLNRKIFITFRTHSSNDISFQVFYTQSNDDHFTENNSIKQNIKAGNRKVKITLPIRKIVRFRLDLGTNPGEVTVSNLKIKGSKKLDLDDGNDFLYKNIDTYKILENKIIIKSNQRDPQIVYKEKFKIRGKIRIDFYIFVILTTIFFFAAYKAVNYLAKFKIDQKESNIDIIFCSMFFILTLIPMSNISKQDKNIAENRMLAHYPILISKNNINTKYGEQFEKWFNDRFFLREQLIETYYKLKSKISLSGNNKVLVGKENWLFYKKNNSLNNYANATVLSTKDMANGLEYLKAIESWCNKNNKKFYYLVAPDKNKIYGEYFRLINKINPDTKGIGNQFVNYIKQNSNINVIYPQQLLLSRKKEGLLYYKNDTHWNDLGAYHGYKALMSEIEKSYNIKEVKIKDWSEKEFSGGDLSVMYKATSNKYKKMKYKKPIFSNNGTCKNIKRYNKENGIINCINETQKYRAFVLRDSFSTALMPYYKETFKTVSAHWKYDIDSKDLEEIKDKYDIIILENVERLTPKIFKQSFPKDY